MTYSRFFLFLWGFAGLIQGAYSQQPPVAMVEVATAAEIEMAPATWFPGTVIGRDDAKLASEVEGRLEQVLDVGDQVYKGDVVARIESTIFDLLVKEAEAEIIPLEAKLDFYEREAKRLQKLARENNAAKNLLDEVESDHAEYVGRLRVAQARLARANDQLNRTVIRAPFDGVVTERYHTHGERVDSGDAIIRLVNTASLEIQVRVPQSYISFLTTGMSLDVKDNQAQNTAMIRTLVPVGDDISRLYEMRLLPQENIWPAGHAVNVAVPTSSKTKVVAISRDALVIRQNAITVVKVNGSDEAEVVKITPGIAKGDLVQIIGDVNPGDRIVIRGNERLRSGQKVSLQ